MERKFLKRAVGVGAIATAVSVSAKYVWPAAYGNKIPFFDTDPNECTPEFLKSLGMNACGEQHTSGGSEEYLGPVPGSSEMVAVAGLAVLLLMALYLIANRRQNA